MCCFANSLEKRTAVLMTLQCLVSCAAIKMSRQNLISGWQRGCSFLLAGHKIYACGIQPPSHWLNPMPVSQILCPVFHSWWDQLTFCQAFGLIRRQHCNWKKSIWVINKYTECSRELRLGLNMTLGVGMCRRLLETQHVFAIPRG